VLAYLVVAILAICIVYMYTTVFRKGTKVSFREWATITAILILVWGVILMVETFWWFWPLLPFAPYTHMIIMALGGLFGIYWGGLYLFVLKGGKNAS